MTRTVITVCGLIAAGLGAGRDLLACGDKFLVPSRGTRFERPAVPRQPAAILLFANPSSELSRRIVTLSVADALMRVGYQPTLASTEDEFAAALDRRRWDLVVIDAGDIGIIERGSDSRRGAAVVPVSYTLSGKHWDEARRRFPNLVKAPKSARTFVDAVDATLDARRAGRGSPKQP